MATATTSRPSGPVLAIPSYRSASPTRVKLAGGSGATRSPGKSVSVSSPSSSTGGAPARSRRSCMCSSTNHPGSFRCSLHKERKQAAPAGSSKPASPPSMRSACSLGSKRMESGHWAHRRGSRQSQHRRRAGGFRPRPSRLSAVSVAGERPNDNQ
ncbi:hypothetical protein CFC21_089872 [Triticum aestivum]|uniref:Serine-rich protein n=2 Tax=Triticum aestivum TaxID=4565 RepID=A0A3B6PU49_WHEAT|nr:uncharacterized protein LOC123134857 [Triticum aestivum]KAF7086586.1 hypothetical protein CFC21_089872 [Triticum aestivum]